MSSPAGQIGKESNFAPKLAGAVISVFALWYLAVNYVIPYFRG